MTITINGVIVDDVLELKLNERVEVNGLPGVVAEISGDLVRIDFGRLPVDHAPPLRTDEQLEQREDRIEGNHD